MKIVNVIPIYKNQDEQLIQNYRPISVLPFFSKIFEKIVASYIIDFLKENNLFIAINLDSENLMVQIMRLVH